MGIEADGTRTVVVGFDGSWQSGGAVATAAREAARRGTGLVVLTVPRPVSPDDHMAADQRAEALSRRGSDLAALVGTTIAIEGLVAALDSSEVVDLAARAELLVLGGHGGGGQMAFSMSSTSQGLARSFPVPLLVPADRGQAQRLPPIDRLPLVVVGLSGADDDASLLEVALEQARWRGSAVVAVRAVRRVPTMGDDELATETTKVWELVHGARPGPEVAVHVVTCAEETVPALLSQCEPDDLLVVGTRGGGRLAGHLRQSVARQVLDAAPCEVMLAPAGHRVAVSATGAGQPTC